jgi:DNA-binding MarR family transcriptional regulator
MRESADHCARVLLAGVPCVMRFIRSEMREHRQVGLTVPHFRALVFMNRREDASVSALAEHLGLSLPATSRLVDLLVRRGLVERREASTDRRRVSLGLTRSGSATCRTALNATQTALARRCEALSAEEATVVREAMDVLVRVFAPENCRIEAGK